MTQVLEDYKNKLYGKTARSFSLTWEPENNALIIELTSRNKDINYTKKITGCSWSFLPFTEEQVKEIENIILGSNLDMWICFQKTFEFILWFMSRNRYCEGGMRETKKTSSFSSDEYDYLYHMKLPDWDLYSRPKDRDYSVLKTEKTLESKEVEEENSGYPYNRFINISSFGGWIGNLWWTNEEYCENPLEIRFTASFGFYGNPKTYVGFGLPFRKMKKRQKES